ncbi:MAG: Rieske (2Fe-2S) protein [Pseudomonadales bacterium]|nr:Rieske (2Fe-2S) protein [Pseudomonadales bacterium]
MPTSRVEDSLTQTLPDSWYCVGRVKSLKTRKIQTVQICGKAIILYRGESGEPFALDAHCPHLGAHLGKGGTVIGEDVRCPFHGFTFNSEGKCTETSYGTPPTAKLCTRSYPVIERNSFIYLYYSENQRTPKWSIPEEEHGDWCRMYNGTFLVNAHVQDLKENAVDLGHFATTHGYLNSQSLAPVTYEGPYLNSKVAFQRKNIMPCDGPFVNVNLNMHSHGMGYTITETTLPDWNARIRHYISYQPYSLTQTRIYYASEVHMDLSGLKSHPLLRLIPAPLMRFFMSMAILYVYFKDLGQDVAIWDHKVHLNEPALIKGDGPIHLFRKYCSQFYSGSGLSEHDLLYNNKIEEEQILNKV